MILYCQGDIFLTRSQCIAHGCNILGKMGAGIAKEFRNRFPDMYEVYKNLCNNSELKVGEIYSYLESKPIILNFMTQSGFYNATLKNIESCLDKICKGRLEISKCHYLNITSLSMPKIGCGLGKLNWNDVNKLITDKLEKSPFDVFIYDNYILNKFSEQEDRYWKMKGDKNEKERLTKTVK